MKRLLIVISIVGILSISMAATTFAARSPQADGPKVGTPTAPTVVVTPTTPDDAQQAAPDQNGIHMGQGARGMGGMMGGGHMGSMMGGNHMNGMMGSGQMNGMMDDGDHANMMGSMMGDLANMMGGMMNGMMDAMTGDHAAMMGDGDHTAMMGNMTAMHADIEQMLGLSHQEFHAQMVAGKSMVQIAAEKGVTEQQLRDGMLQGRKAALDQAVKDGRMTQEQADTMFKYMQSHIDDMLNAQGIDPGTSQDGMMDDPQSSQPSQPRLDFGVSGMHG